MSKKSKLREFRYKVIRFVLRWFLYVAKHLWDLEKNRILWKKSKPEGMPTFIEINNLTKPQRIALEDMLKTWLHLSSLGGSRWTCYYADGDGNFHPKIKIDGRDPKYTDLIKDRRERVWKNDEYRIDFDMIAWALHKDK